MTTDSFRRIDVDDLVRILAGSSEIALVDVREEGAQARNGHIIHAVPLPLSVLELRAKTLLRRRGVPIVVVDETGGGLAERAALRLAAIGFADVSILEGGVTAWQIAGREIYTGTSVYSKAFGEFVEHTYKTPHLSAKELQQRLERQEDVVVVDGRTVQEFENFSIPGAYAVPNAELPYRIHGLVKSPETLVVVNCAGRTRSIIGAQALINAGLSNQVVSLQDGTIAWIFEGYALNKGLRRELPVPTGDALENAKRSVQTLTERFKLRWLDQRQLQAFRDEQEERALFVYDVRTRAEYEAGHLLGVEWIEGGQLIQGIDRHVGVRNARIVVVDDETGVRAAITASWLAQLGWGEVYALAVPQAGAGQAQGFEAPQPWVSPPEVQTLAPQALAEVLADGSAVLIDLAPGPVYETGHIPGAQFAVRARLPHGLEKLTGRPLVLTSPDGVQAAFAAQELSAASPVPIRILQGGTQGWRAAGLPLEAGLQATLHTPDDAAISPYDEKEDLHGAFRRYIKWEVQLIEQVLRDPTVRFNVFA